MNKRPLLPAALAAALVMLCHSPAWSQGFALEGAIIDSRTGQSLGVVTEKGDLNALFRAQKAMTFGILRSAGISLEQLSPEVRARIERFQTTNVEAFRAFSQGLDLKDQGKFAQAREQFKRAAELDPNFALASEQQQSMPDVNLGSGLQVRAVMQAVAGAAVDKGKATFVVDVARAAAAIQAGQTVVTVAAPPTEAAVVNDYKFSSNQAGASNRFGANLVVGLAYGYTAAGGAVVNPIAPSEWRSSEYRVSNGVLESVGASGGGFLAQRLNAASANTGNTTLSDGTAAYWGSWLSAPGSSATLTVSGSAIAAPNLGRVDYVLADATRVMPSAGVATYTPSGGLLSNVSGNIGVNFVNRSVTLQNLGFQLGSLNFAGLAGSATYSDTSRSGAFNGNYSAGTCTGCAGFTPGASSFAGNFVGPNAGGLVLSTILLTGNGGTASGVHLFGR